MGLAEIMLMLAEIAAARSVVLSPTNIAARQKAELEWQAALKQGSGAAAVYRDRIQPLHDWRKAAIDKAVTKARSGFGLPPRKSPCTTTASHAVME